jgi:pimeloyl-ACP methyl ester carboxylesterase
MDLPPSGAPYELPSGYSPASIPKLTFPTLLFLALDDVALPTENLEGLYEIIDDLTLVEVPGSGHFVPWEAPESVNAAIDDFLQRTAG